MTATCFLEKRRRMTYSATCGGNPAGAPIPERLSRRPVQAGMVVPVVAIKRGNRYAISVNHTRYVLAVDPDGKPFGLAWRPENVLKVREIAKARGEEA